MERFPHCWPLAHQCIVPTKGQLSGCILVTLNKLLIKQSSWQWFKTLQCWYDWYHSAPVYLCAELYFALFDYPKISCRIVLDFIIPSRSCRGVYWFHSVRPSVRLFTHFIKQLQKVCRVESFLQNFEIWIFGIFFLICNFNFVFFWLEIWCESLEWVIMGWKVSQNAGVLVVLVFFTTAIKVYYTN